MEKVTLSGFATYPARICLPRFKSKTQFPLELAHAMTERIAQRIILRKNFFLYKTRYKIINY
jgi:hypothetical protein